MYSVMFMFKNFQMSAVYFEYDSRYRKIMTFCNAIVI